MKALIIRYGEGLYDAYAEITLGVFLIPDDATFKSLDEEYSLWCNDAKNRVLVRKRGNKTAPMFNFVQWMQNCHPEFKQLDFEDEVL
jgi:hypothetical protein